MVQMSLDDELRKFHEVMLTHSKNVRDELYDIMLEDIRQRYTITEREFATAYLDYLRSVNNE